jgi:hypothetical protein
MKLIIANAKPASVFLSIVMLLLAIPYQTALAAMVGTENVIDSVRGRQARDEINNLLLREETQNALKAQGIDPLEAKARIDSLSDAEVIQIADQIDKFPAPAGGNLNIAYPWWLFPAVVLGLVLIIAGIIYLASSD